MGSKRTSLNLALLVTVLVTLFLPFSGFATMYEDDGVVILSGTGDTSIQRNYETPWTIGSIRITATDSGLVQLKDTGRNAVIWEHMVDSNATSATKITEKTSGDFIYPRTGLTLVTGISASSCTLYLYGHTGVRGSGL